MMTGGAGLVLLELVDTSNQKICSSHKLPRPHRLQLLYKMQLLHPCSSWYVTGMMLFCSVPSSWMCTVKSEDADQQDLVL